MNLERLQQKKMEYDNTRLEEIKNSNIQEFLSWYEEFKEISLQKLYNLDEKLIEDALALEIEKYGGERDISFSIAIYPPYLILLTGIVTDLEAACHGCMYITNTRAIIHEDMFDTKLHFLNKEKSRTLDSCLKFVREYWKNNLCIHDAIDTSKIQERFENLGLKVLMCEVSDDNHTGRDNIGLENSCNFWISLKIRNPVNEK